MTSPMKFYCVLWAPPSALDVREASERVLQSLNALASGMLSPDQNETSTAMADEAARAIEDATIIHDFLSAPPVADLEAIIKELQSAKDAFGEIRLDWSDPRDKCREGSAAINRAIALLHPQPAKGER